MRLSRKPMVIAAVVAAVAVAGWFLFAFRTTRLPRGDLPPIEVSYRWAKPHRLLWDANGDGEFDRMSLVKVERIGRGKHLTHLQVWVDSDYDGQMDYHFPPAGEEGFVAYTDPDDAGQFQTTIRGPDAKTLYCQYMNCGPIY